MSRQRPWRKLYKEWLTSPSHIGLGIGARAFGLLLPFVEEPWDEDGVGWLCSGGEPLSEDVLASLLGTRPALLRTSIDLLLSRKTIVRREHDGAIGFRNYRKWQEHEDTERKRQWRSGKRDVPGTSPASPREEDQSRGREDQEGERETRRGRLATALSLSVDDIKLSDEATERLHELDADRFKALTEEIGRSQYVRGMPPGWALATPERLDRVIGGEYRSREHEGDRLARELRDELGAQDARAARARDVTPRDDRRGGSKTLAARPVAEVLAEMGTPRPRTNGRPRVVDREGRELDPETGDPLEQSLPAGGPTQ